MGLLHHFLGVEVALVVSGLFISQSLYLQDVLSWFKMDCAKPMSTPMSSNVSLLPVNLSAIVDATEFHNFIGLLQHLTFSQS